MFTVVDSDTGELIKVFDVKLINDDVYFLTFNCSHWKYIPSDNYIPIYEFTDAERESARIAQIIAKGDF